MDNNDLNKKEDAAAKKPRLSVIKILIILAALAAVVLTGLFFTGNLSLSAGKSTAELGATPLPVTAEPMEASEFAGYELKGNVETLLIFGVDKFEKDTHTDSYNNTQQADFFLLMVFDRDAEQLRAIALNRDTMTDVMVLGVRGEKAGYKTMQLALSHNYGSGGKDSSHNTVDAVSRLLKDVKIDHYICLTMDAIPIINDLCGGITVTPDEYMVANNDKFTAGKPYTLKGDEALAYVRSRSQTDEDANINRMGRQQEYLQALSEKLMAVPEDDDKEFVLKLTTALSDYMESDCSVTQLDRLFDMGQSYTNEGFLSIKGDNTLGEEFIEFYPDETALIELVREVFYKKVG